MSPKPFAKKTILVFAISGVGHVNATAGATLPLIRRGHRVIFVLEQAFAGQLVPLGFEEHLYKQKLEEEYAPEESSSEQKPGEEWANVFLDSGLIGPKSPEEKMGIFVELFIKSKTAKSLFSQLDGVMKEAIEIYKPDLLWVDAPYQFPSVYYSGIPWVHNMSNSPFVDCGDPELPPGCSGYPFNAPKDAAWHRFKDLHVNQFLHSKDFNDHIEEMGYPRYPNDVILPDDESLVTVFAFPDELLLPQIRAKRWFNLEVFNKNDEQETVDLKELVGKKFFEDTLDGKWSGKWVYVSMGSMGSIDLAFMKRLLDALAETTHKYIVSKGPRHTEYGLPSNAWGDRYLPQTKLVPLMDLVITHGGNNTVTETFAKGKPMIVLPLFSDQYDNAQRMHETGFGVRLNPNNFTKTEVIQAVNKLLYDQSLKQLLQKASERILNSGKHEQLAVMVETLLAENL